MTMLEELSSEPKHYPDCCAGVSKPLIEAIIHRLPQHPALVLSIGCGNGFLEGLLLRESAGQLNLCGVEIPSCTNKYLPSDRLLRVPDTRAVHPDAFLASALMFVYPRMSELMNRYISECSDGAVEKVIWLGHRNDWPDYEQWLLKAFFDVEYVEGPGFPEYELLVVASTPRPRRNSG